MTMTPDEALQALSDPYPPGHSPQSNHPGEGGQPPASEVNKTQQAGSSTEPGEVKEPLAPIDELVEEYGIGGATGTSDPTHLIERMAEMERELEFERGLRQHPLAGLSEKDVNERIKELRDDGNHIEAERMLRDFEEYRGKNPAKVKELMVEKAKAEVMRYISQGGQNAKLATLLSDPKVVTQLREFTGLVRTDLPGGARVLHLLALGLKAGEIAAKAEAIGRNSWQKVPPAGRSGSAIHKGSTTARSQPSSDMMQGAERLSKLMRS